MFDFEDCGEYIMDRFVDRSDLNTPSFDLFLSVGWLWQKLLALLESGPWNFNIRSFHIFRQTGKETKKYQKTLLVQVHSFTMS